MVICDVIINLKIEAVLHVDLDEPGVPSSDGPLGQSHPSAHDTLLQHPSCNCWVATQ